MNFAYPQGRICLVLAFAAAALAVLALVRKRRALRRLARQGIYQPGVLVRPVRQIFKCLLLLLVALLLGIAVLGPQWGWIEEEVPPRRGRDVVIVLDVSRSMLVEDVAPNRLERAKADLRGLADYLERAGGYRIGLITFAERAAVLCPLTSDYRCFAEELADASLKSLRLRGHTSWGDGTQISTALDRADQIIDDKNAAYTDVLLVSDGGDMARETLASVDALARRGITVHTLGLGDPDRGSLIPVRDRFGRPAQLHYRGEVVSTQLQEAVLQAIAERTHGRYFAVRTGAVELDRQFGDMLSGKKSLERQAIHRQRHGIHRFQWFVAPALVLLLLHWLLSDARRPGRDASERPNYFHWVRKRAANPPSRERPRAVLLHSLTLMVLTSMAAWSLALSAGPAEPADPWTAFRRGNELLRQAQQAGMKADPAWLLQAQQQYRKCLARQASTPKAGTLFEDARYNLEIAKLLLSQISQSGTNVGPTDPKAPSEESAAETSPNDDKNTASDKTEAKQQSRQRNNEDKEERKKSSSNAEKNNSDSGQNKSDSGRSKSDSGQNRAKGQSFQQAKQKQQQQQQSNGKSGSGSSRSTAKKHDSQSRKSTRSGKGSPSDGSDSKQIKQADQHKNNEKNSGTNTKSSSGQTDGGQERKEPSANNAKRLAANQGKMPALSDLPREDEPRGRGRGRGREPDARGLFHPETPVEKQLQSASGRGSQGDSAGGGPSKAKTPGELDLVVQAAVMRLQQAIQRIENRRGRRVTGPAPAVEDPANMKRFRDW